MALFDDVQDLKTEVRKLQDELQRLNAKEEEIRRREERIAGMENQLENLTVKLSLGILDEVKEFRLGVKDDSIKMDRQGLWVGKNTFSEAVNIGINGVDGGAIAIDGSFYPKGGVSGLFVISGGGPAVTVTNGIITNIV